MADFPLDFPVVFMVSIIMNRLRYIIELSNCVLLWFEKNFASDSSHCWSSLECYVNGYHHHRLLQGVWSHKISSFWGCLH